MGWRMRRRARSGPKAVGVAAAAASVLPGGGRDAGMEVARQEQGRVAEGGMLPPPWGPAPGMLLLHSRPGHPELAALKAGGHPRCKPIFLWLFFFFSPLFFNNIKVLFNTF